MRPVETVDLRSLIYEINLELIALLKTLEPAQWQLPTACEGWTVHDLVAHLWGGDVGRLSGGRDRHDRPIGEINNYDDLLAWIDRGNAVWVEAARRISPQMLINLIAISNQQLYQYWRGCDLNADSIGVAWAGETQSALWFDIGREYTEKWMHQQHIREALGVDGLIQRRWMHPALDLFMRGMPHAYRSADAPDGTQISVEIEGEAGGFWTLQRENHAWQLLIGAANTPRTSIKLTQDTAWRLFTNGLTLEQAAAQITHAGDSSLGTPFLKLIAIMA